jgi:hypothetical protein
MAARKWAKRLILEGGKLRIVIAQYRQRMWTNRPSYFGIGHPSPYPFTHMSSFIREMPALERSSAALSVVADRLKFRTIADNFSVDSVINARHQPLLHVNGELHPRSPLSPRSGFRFGSDAPLLCPPSAMQSCICVFLCIP